MTQSDRRRPFPFLRDGRLRGDVFRRVVEQLADRVGRAVSRDELAEAVWPDGRGAYWTKQLTECARSINRAVGAELIRQIRDGHATIGYQIDFRHLRPGLYRVERPYRIDEATGLRRWAPWTRAEDELLRRSIGRMTASEIAETINSTLSHAYRTPDGVRWRAGLMGLSYAVEGLSAKQVAEILGIHSTHLSNRLIRPGYLRATRRKPRLEQSADARNRWWVITEADLEAFIRDYPWHYDYRLMRRGHRLRSLAETVHRQDPWLFFRDVVRIFGVDRTQVFRYLREGRLPNAKRMRTMSGKPNGAWRIPASDVRRLALELAQHPSSNQHPNRRRKKTAA